MNFNKVFEEIEKIDPEVYERFDGRRGAIKSLTSFTGKLAALAVPFAFGSMLKKAYGQTPSAIIDVLNFALMLELLETEFYTRALATPGLIPQGPEHREAFTIIRNNEMAHVMFLRTAIQAAGGKPVDKANYDFTAGNGTGRGPAEGVFEHYDIFLAVSQVFEDNGVRAYKGQAPALMSNNEILTAALRIHSVEARHIAHIRMVREMRGANVQPWITLNRTDIPGSEPVYMGEENTVQAGIQIVNINGFPIDAEDASEAFDEPLTKEQVMRNVDPFIV